MADKTNLVRVEYTNISTVYCLLASLEMNVSLTDESHTPVLNILAPLSNTLYTYRVLFSLFIDR